MRLLATGGVRPAGALAAVLTVALMIAAPAAAQSPTDAQYDDAEEIVEDRAGADGAGGAGGTDDAVGADAADGADGAASSDSTEGADATGGALGSGGEGGGPGGDRSAGGKDGDVLPFTGSDMLILALVAISLAAAGLGLRRLSAAR